MCEARHRKKRLRCLIEQLELLIKEKDRNWGNVESAGTCQQQNS